MASPMFSPGVYVRFAPSGFRPLTMVPTSICGFVGCAPDAAAHRGEVVSIENRAQFKREFCNVANPQSTHLSNAVFGFFANGGSRCYVVNVGDGTLVAPAGERGGIALLEEVSDCALVAAPGYTDPASYAAILAHCSSAGMGDRFAILDAPLGADPHRLTEPASTTPSGDDKKKAGGSGGQRCAFHPESCGAIYAPWIRIDDPLRPGRELVVPPSGHLAGVYARTDALVGVHKAPANCVIEGVTGLERVITRAQQDMLNPAGVNVLRQMPHIGITPWGARTIGPSTSEYRYIPVKRLALAIKQTLEEQVAWAVFEPNHPGTWSAIKASCEAFLKDLWRSQALVGNTPDEAFYVKCDSETNPPESQKQGRLVTEIGFSPTQPAEFVCFELSQAMQMGAGDDAGSE